MPEATADALGPSLPRTDRAAATRARLFEAGRRAFASKGLAGTNLKADILAPARVSVGSFYHQFRDKTELLLAILDAHSEQFRERLREAQRPRPGRTASELAREAFALVLAVAEESADVQRIQLRERDSGDERVRDYLRRDRERWLKSLIENFDRVGEALGVRIEGRSAAELTHALSLGAVARFLELPEQVRAEARARLLDDLVRFTLGGLPALAKGPTERDETQKEGMTR